MDDNYLFIDGSSLLSDIKKLKSTRKEFKDKKLNPIIFCRQFLNSWSLRQFHNSGYRRIVFYFVNNDSRVKENIVIPDFSKSGRIEDMQIKYCGKKIPVYAKAEDWLDKNSAPQFVLESLYKSEKAVDSQICCDALILLSLNKLNRLFLYTNDYDFIPLCQSIKTMGANINLIKLTEERVNIDLVKECDAFYSFSDIELKSMFEIKEQELTPKAEDEK